MSLIIPKEYLDGVRFFNEGLYFEAHEEWEKLWLKAEDEERVFYQGLIQAAACLLKLFDGDPKAAAKLFLLATQKLSQVSNTYLGLDVRKFEKDFQDCFKSPDKPPRIHIVF